MLKLLIDEEGSLSTSEWTTQLKSLRDIIGDNLKFNQTTQKGILEALERVYNDNFVTELDLLHEDEEEV